MSPAPATTVIELVELYHRWGADRYDEELSQLDHALQTAALAVADGAPDPLIAAALLHDVGHLLELDSGGGHDPSTDIDLAHEASGARYLSALFPPNVTGPIALHVRAKRYRCAVDADYLDTLSEGSRRSLQRQGGPFDDAETEAFEANPGFDDAVLLRGWDDHGKVDGLQVAPFDAYADLLERLALVLSHETHP